jgi:peptidoglycan/LPS O-acetylase OafA/YrhL
MQGDVIKLDQLTGWRFIAAFGVVLCHFSEFLFPNQPQVFLSLWKGMANFVGFFFILSGFILAYNYQAKMVAGKTTVRSFLVARFARIYPALIFSLVISIPAFLTINYKLHTPVASFLAYSLSSVLLIKTWLPFANWDGISAWNAPTWSIETEFFFYLCFPFLIRPLSKLTMRSNISLWIALVGLMTGAAASFDIFAPRPGIEPFFGAFELLHSSPYFCVFEFILGILTFNIAKNLPKQTLSYVRDNSRWIFALLVGSYLGLNVILPVMSRFHGIPAIVFCGAILLSYTSPVPLKFLQTPKFLYLGETSYSLYLLHSPVLGLFLLAAKIFGPLGYLKQELPPLFAILAIATSFGLAALCHKFVEVPWRTKIIRKLAPRNEVVFPKSEAKAA